MSVISTSEYQNEIVSELMELWLSLPVNERRGDSHHIKEAVSGIGIISSCIDGVPLELRFARWVAPDQPYVVRSSAVDGLLSILCVTPHPERFLPALQTALIDSSQLIRANAVRAIIQLPVHILHESNLMNNLMLCLRDYDTMDPGISFRLREAPITHSAIRPLLEQLRLHAPSSFAWMCCAHAITRFSKDKLDNGGLVLLEEALEHPIWAIRATGWAVLHSLGCTNSIYKRMLEQLHNGIGQERLIAARAFGSAICMEENRPEILKALLNTVRLPYPALRATALQSIKQINALSSCEPETRVIIDQIMSAHGSTVLAGPFTQILDHSSKHEGATDFLHELKEAMLAENLIETMDISAEAETLNVKSHVLIIQPTIQDDSPLGEKIRKEHGGRVAKYVHETSSYRNAAGRGELYWHNRNILAVFRDAETAVRCATETNVKLINSPGLTCGMGLDSGDIKLSPDEQGLLLLQGRVIDNAEAISRHAGERRILLTSATVDEAKNVLSELGILEDLGDCAPGNRPLMHLYNLFDPSGKYGHRGHPIQIPTWRTRRQTEVSPLFTIIKSLAQIALLLIIGFSLWQIWRTHQTQQAEHLKWEQLHHQKW